MDDPVDRARRLRARAASPCGGDPARAGSVVRTGMGPRRSRAAARRPSPTAAPARSLVAGVAGGARRRLAPGDVVVADEVATATASRSRCLPAAPLVAAAAPGRAARARRPGRVAADDVVDGDRRRRARRDRRRSPSTWSRRGSPAAAARAARRAVVRVPSSTRRTTTLLRPATLVRRPDARSGRCAAPRPALDAWAAADRRRARSLLAEPAVVLRRRRTGHRRSSSGPSSRYGAAGLRAPADRAQRPRRARPGATRRGVRRGARRGARRRASPCSPPTGSPRRSATRGQRPRPRGDRRHLPAGRQGAHRGAPLRRRAATRCCSSATPTTRRSRAPRARRPEQIRWSSRTSPTARRLRGPRPATRVAYLDADHARRRRGRGDRRPSCASASPRSPAPRRRRHLLRHHEPPAGGARGRRRMPTWCSSSARRTPRTRTAWSRSPAARASPAHLVDDDDRDRPALARRRRTRRRSPPAPRRPTTSSTRWSTASAGLGAGRPSSSATATDEDVSVHPAQGGALTMAMPLRQTMRVAAYLMQAEARQARRSSRCSSSSSRCSPATSRAPGCGKIQHPPRSCASSGCRSSRRVGAIEECGAPMVLDRRRRAADAPGDRRDRRRAGRAQEVRLPLHQRRAAAQAPATDFTPSPYFAWMVHIDGLRERHDAVGATRTACSTRRSRPSAMAKERGFRVTTNTTFFNTDTPQTCIDVLDFLNDELEVDNDDDLAGLRLREGARPGALPRRRARPASCSARRSPSGRRQKWRLNHSPLFLDFLEGKIDFECTAWAIPSYSLLGWQRPCYLMSDGYVQTYQELIETTDWSAYGRGQRPALRQLHGALRLRADGGGGHHPLAARVATRPRERPLTPAPSAGRRRRRPPAPRRCRGATSPAPAPG